MTDTSTTEAPEATTEAPAAPTPKVDHAGNFATALVKASAMVNEAGDDLTDEGRNTVWEALRAVPSAARGTAQGAALKAVLDDGQADSLEYILNAINSLPKATSSRATKPSLDPTIALAIQGAGILVAFSEIGNDPEYGADAATLAKDWFSNGSTPPEHVNAVLQAASNAIKGSAKRGGAGGTRATFDETLTDLIADDRLKTPATLVGKVNGEEVTCRVMKSGKVKFGDAEFDNLSAAAGAARGEGKSVNGWDFWSYEGTAVGKLRTK
jgi:hypothetical protein